MKVNYPVFPLYDKLKNKVVPECDIKEVCETLNNISDSYINEHLEIIIALVIHHNLIKKNGNYEGSFDGLKQRPNYSLINLGMNADREIVNIICAYYMENVTK